MEASTNYPAVFGNNLPSVLRPPAAYWRLETVHPSSSKARIHMELRFYRDRVERWLKTHSSALQNKLSIRRKEQLESFVVPYDFDEVVIQSQKELDTLLETKTVQRKSRAQNALPGDIGSNQAALADPSVIEGEVLNEPDDGVHLTTSPKSTESDVGPVVGVIKSIGQSLRKKEGRRFEHTYMDVEVDDLDGAVQRMWGEDLPRAIEAADVKNGDRVRVIQHGFTNVPVTVNGVTKVVRRKAYTIDKL